MKKRIATLLLCSLNAFAGAYSVNGETMECRINAGNGIPALPMETTDGTVLKMNYQENGVFIEATYVPSEANQIQFYYFDGHKMNKVNTAVPLRDLNIDRVKATASIQLTFADELTVVTCNVRNVPTGSPIPPSPKLK